MPTYSFLDISASIDGPGGNFPLGAGAGVDKEGITIAFADDKNKQDVGADGQPLNSLRAAQNGTVTVRLQKTSPVNAMLSAMYNTQKQSSATWGQNTMLSAIPSAAMFIRASSAPSRSFRTTPMPKKPAWWPGLSTPALWNRCWAPAGRVCNGWRGNALPLS
jgi:hypothetical protein